MLHIELVCSSYWYGASLISPLQGVPCDDPGLYWIVHANMHGALGLQHSPVLPGRSTSGKNTSVCVLCVHLGSCVILLSVVAYVCMCEV